MSFPPYESYKDSGVEWLGEVPRGWDIRRVKRLFEIKKRICGVEGYAVLSITQHGIRVKDIESGDGQLSMDYSKYQIVEIGDFAMNHMDLLTGSADIASFFGVTSPDYRVFCVRDKEVCFDRYYLYLFLMGYRKKIFYAFGQGSSQLGRWRFPTDQFNGFEFPSPPIQEQKRIANFLDRETTKIDTLIAEQQRLIALLAEKRQAMISHAVTKGLNPDAQMKDSGIEWLGKVPKHWEVSPLKRGFDVCLGKMLQPEASSPDDELLPYLRAANIQWSGVDISDVNVMWFSHRERQQLALKIGDLLVSEGGDVGRSAVWQAEMDVCYFQNAINRIRAKENNYNRFLYYWMSTIKAKGFIDIICNKSTIAHFTAEKVAAVPVPFPPLPEQQSIVAFLDRETAQLDTLTAEVQRAITLLQERRTALISAAVTGKIDVRHLTERDAA